MYYIYIYWRNSCETTLCKFLVNNPGELNRGHEIKGSPGLFNFQMASLDRMQI